MKLMFACVLLPLLGPLRCWARAGVPVFLLDEDRVGRREAASNPLATVSMPDFGKMIWDVVNKSEVIIVFVEPTLCVEDFRRQDENGTSFPRVRALLKADKAGYYPSVQSAARTLETVLEPREHHVFNVTERTAKVRIFKNDIKKYMYINFQDADESESRLQHYRRHDRMIYEFYQAMRQMAKGHVIGFYTARENPTPLGLPSAEPRARLASVTPGVFVANKGAYIYMENVDRTVDSARSPITEKPTIRTVEWTDRAMTVDVTFRDAVVRFNFRFDPRSWILDDVYLMSDEDIVCSSRVGLVAPWKSSVANAGPIVLRSPTLQLTIGKYQIQAFHPSEPGVGRDGGDFPAPREGHHLVARRADGPKFGPNGSVEYFTIPILVCLSVVFLLLAILAFGLCMIVDIRTYDRFDDPQGPQLMLAFDE